MIVVALEQLQQLAALLPPEPTKPAISYRGTGEPFDLDRWITEHNIQVHYHAPWGTGEKCVLEHCVWNADHTDKSAFILRHQNGAIAAGCHHNSCQGKGWPELREVLEPGYRERRQAFGSAYTPTPPNTNGTDHHPDKPWWDYSFTDDGNRERLVALHGHDLRFVWAWNKWLTWDGKRWNTNIPGEVHRRASDTIRRLYAEASNLEAIAARTKTPDESKRLAELAESLSKWARTSLNRPKLEAMVSLARAYLDVDVKDLDADPDLLNCQNGTLHLPSGELRTHEPSDLITKLAGAPYEQIPGRNNLWLRFIEEALPDEAAREYTQKLAGYTLSGRPDHDVVILFHGPGGTGKSTFQEPFRTALGEYAASADIATFTTKRDPHAPQPDLARLAGKRLVTIPEAQGSGGIISLLKAVSGGDAIQTRSHRQETFDLEPTFTLWLRANKRPRIPDDDTGVWRRIKEIPFLHRFRDPDESIRRTLNDPIQSGAFILSWAAEGYRKFLTDGLKPPKTVIDATGEYRQEMDPLPEWLEEEAVIDPNAWSATANLFNSYRNWAKASGESFVLGKKGFSQRMSERFTPHNKGRQGGRGFRGVGLLSGHEVLTERLPPDTETTLQDKKDQESVVIFENDVRVSNNYTPSVGSVVSDTNDNTSGNETLPEPSDGDSSVDNICSRCWHAVPTEAIHSYGAEGEVICTNCAESELERV